MHVYEKNIHYLIIVILLIIPYKGINMMKEIVLMLVAMANVTPMSSTYLLVELQDTADEIIAPHDDSDEGDVHPGPQGRKLK